MEDQSDARLYRIIRTVVRTYLKAFPQARLGTLDESDLTHAIYVRFVENDRAQLAKFVPERGSFAGFVAMKTRFWLQTIGRKNWNRESIAHFEPMGDEEFEDFARRDIDEVASMRERLFAVADCVEGRVTRPEDKLAVDLLFRRLATDKEFEARFGLDGKGLSDMKSRLRRHARACLELLFPEGDS